MGSLNLGPGTGGKGVEGAAPSGPGTQGPRDKKYVTPPTPGHSSRSQGARQHGPDTPDSSSLQGPGQTERPGRLAGLCFPSQLPCRLKERLACVYALVGPESPWWAASRQSAPKTRWRWWFRTAGAGSTSEAEARTGLTKPTDPVEFHYLC